MLVLPLDQLIELYIIQIYAQLSLKKLPFSFSEMWQITKETLREFFVTLIFIYLPIELNLLNVCHYLPFINFGDLTPCLTLVRAASKKSWYVSHSTIYLHNFKLKPEKNEVVILYKPIHVELWLFFKCPQV